MDDWQESELQQAIETAEPTSSVSTEASSSGSAAQPKHFRQKIITTNSNASHIAFPRFTKRENTGTAFERDNRAAVIEFEKMSRAF